MTQYRAEPTPGTALTPGTASTSPGWWREAVIHQVRAWRRILDEYPDDRIGVDDCLDAMRPVGAPRTWVIPWSGTEAPYGFGCEAAGPSRSSCGPVSAGAEAVLPADSSVWWAV
ncbi:hypothetical protein AB0D78_39765 [Streptomyces avermitilis]|uniref:hypothetical protein n=1 Tax=Streptomyces avermitilis TaxID=33903 RepID=UPI0034067ABB